MKKLLLLTICSLLLFTGCGEKKEENNKPIDNDAENKEPIETEKPIPEISSQIVSELNELLLESGSEQHFIYVSKENASNNSINYIYQTNDKMKLEVEFNDTNKLESLTVYAPPSKTITSNREITKDYINTKLFFLKLKVLHISQKEADELSECLTGTKTGFCFTIAGNFTGSSRNEATDSYPSFTLLIHHLPTE